MKKFFSLVLALVMALSLTTVAWGADTITVGTSGNKATLAEAVEAAQTGDTIKLLEKVTVSSDLTIDKAVTIDTNGVAGYAITVDGAKLTLGTGVTVTAAANEAILVKAGAELVIAGATVQSTANNGKSFIDVEGTMTITDGAVCSKYTAVIYIAGSGVLNVNGGAIYNTDAGDKVAVAIKPFGTKNGTVKVTAGKVYSVTASAIAVDAGTTGTINISGGEVYTNAPGQVAAVFGYSGTINVSGGTIENTNAANTSVALLASSNGSTPATVTVSGGNVQSVGHRNNATAQNVVVTGGTFAVAPDDAYLNGLTTAVDTNGNYYVTAPTALGEKFDLYLANYQLNTNLKAGAATVTDVILTEVPANTFANGSGNVAYVKGNNGEYYVKTTSPVTTSYAVTAADKTTVLYYVNAAGNDAGAFTYIAKATEFNNFSLAAKCGYVTGKPDVGATYFQLADGTVYKAADASATEANNYLVGDTVYSKGAPQTVVKHYFKANNYKYDAVAGNIPTSAICTTCLTTSTAIYKDEKVPAGTFAYELNGDTAYAVVVGTTTSAPTWGGTSTDKVTSAETFDAGIAMYVGMSVMAAAGSAVVIGKKKD